jgi:hypothetical protein
MTDEQFDRLPGKLKAAYLLGVASRLFGREQVQQLYDNLKPLVDDMFAHGQAGAKRIPGEEEDPAADYWGGVWQVYRAD